MERNRPFMFLSRETAARNPFIHESEYADANANGTGRTEAGSIRTGDRGVMKKGPEKPVGLNLVTNFSISGSAAQNEGSGPAFVDLNDLKMLSKEREKERSTQKIRDMFRKRTFQGFQRLPEGSVGEGSNSFLDTYGRPSASKKGRDELSPSDRPIMIGYTVPHGVQSSGDQKDRAKEIDSAGSNPTPLTPSIIVTPAREDSFWLDPSTEYRRPRSSVYSQPTPHIGNTQSDIPPVPAIPAHHSVARAGANLPQRQSIFSTRNRSLSTGTVFEEDATPRLGRRSRSFSVEDSKITAQRESVSSFVNKHRSQGWWTYLLSPLLGRSNTDSSKTAQTPTSAEHPPVPSVLTTSTEWWEKDASCFSPDTPETAVASRGIDFGEPGNNSKKDGCDTYGDNPVEYGVASVMFPGGQVQGAAAEYYQACAHELFSRRPYFECINHVCSITPKDQIAAVLDPAVPSTEGTRGLNLLDVDTPRESTNPFEPPNARRFSGSTAVNEESDDPFGISKGKAAEDTNTNIESPRTASPAPASPPAKEKELPKAPEPALLHPSEKQGSSQNQSVTVMPAPYIHFPSSPRPSQPLAAPTERDGPRPITIFPGVQPPVQSPDVPSPAFQQATERGGVPLSDINDGPAPAYGSHENSYPIPPPRSDIYPVSRAEIVDQGTERRRIEIHRQRLEREDEIGRKSGGLWRGRGPISKKGCFGRPGREGRLRRRWYLAIAAFFLVIIIVAVVLATTLTRKGDETPVESRWLNLTGYPPMPTGIATIAGPEPQEQNSGCIVPSDLWSCALPKEQQNSNEPYPSNKPNFRVAIRFRNGTYANSTMAVSNTTRSFRARDDDLFKPSPEPPSIADQTFLGNTTDNNSEPYAGEETPFYITFVSPMKLSSSTSQLIRRADQPSSFPDISAHIPEPDKSADGTAAPALLYPLPESQPIRLYNRDQPTEHYGFYTYFDRSIFLTSSAPLTGISNDTNEADQNGGSKKENARVRCTWAQTRFLVQIWTRPDLSGMALLEDTPSTSTSAASTTSSASPTSNQNSNSNSSAMNFTRPGSFPYPITIAIDRHGGNPKKKMVYCYGLEDGAHFNMSEKKLQIEDRGVGGSLVNPAPGIFNTTAAGDGGSMFGKRDSDENENGNGKDGFDGGTGGCACSWRNWVGLID